MKKTFTFQYGQIYYRDIDRKREDAFNVYIPIWLDLLLTQRYSVIDQFTMFTFQYGQIYYVTFQKDAEKINAVYIPIWLDLLFVEDILKKE